MYVCMYMYMYIYFVVWLEYNVKLIISWLMKHAETVKTCRNN